MHPYKRLTLLCGHYGSGKTNVALNMAFELKRQYAQVAIADLDIVNPYFRTKDSSAALEREGIRLIVSPYAGSNVDIPAMPQEMYAICDDRQLHAVVDVGGDDRGALALGRLVPAILEENDYEMLMVINRYRPLTPDAASTMEVMREIETACGLRFTGLVNNSNLGAQTTARDISDSMEYAQAVAEQSGLPLMLTSVRADFYEALKDNIPDLFPMQLQQSLPGI